MAQGRTFSAYSAVACHSKFRTPVAAQHLLIESDQGAAVYPASIRCRVERVKHLCGQQLMHPPSV